MIQDDALPPLPEAEVLEFGYRPGAKPDAYTAAQMYDYARDVLSAYMEPAVQWQTRMRHRENGKWDDWCTSSRHFAEAVWRGEHSDGSWEFEARALGVVASRPK